MERYANMGREHRERWISTAFGRLSTGGECLLFGVSTPRAFD